MKIYISCNGLGLGHVGRSLAFANMLKKRGDEVIFASWGPAVDFAKKEGYKCYRLPNIDWYDREDGSLDFAKTILYSPAIIAKLLKLISKEKQIILKEKPSVIVSDNNFAHIAAKKINVLSIFLTHQITFRQAGKIFDKILCMLHKSNFSRVDKMCINDLEPPNSIYPLSVLKGKRGVYVGPLIRNEPPKQVRKGKKKLCFILISGPKQSPYAFEKEILKIEGEFLKMKEWDFIIKAPSKIPGKSNIKYVQWLDDIYKYLSKCDVFVSRSGYSTVCDVLAYAKKSILIPQINQSEQEIIAEHLNKKHLAVALEQKKMKNLPGLIRQLRKDRQMEKNLETFSELIKKDSGAQNIVKVIDCLAHR
ncbi:MAG: hypothetical protein DRN66_01170 [Candidatus Nanohalarchaeota archaeon]|nr:MAG: hypothetical protein DRN66_01170 [Candidatus Nanohaloarchaeota archaeon]